MAIQIIIDSSSDISPDEAKQLDIILLPLTVRFGAEEFEDSVTLSHQEFYERLIESDELPATSQLTPFTYSNIFEQVISSGDTAIVITLSSRLSGTYQSAVIAAQDYESKIFIIDSENVCVGERILIQRALTLRAEGFSAEEIVSRLNKEKKHIRLLALLDTLEYLKKGGRISAATAFAGGVLSVKPVVAVTDGEVSLIGKARGSKNGNNLLRELVKKSGGVNFNKPFALAYSGLTDALLKKYIKDSEELWHGKTDALPISTVGCVIGTHVGPGAIAIAFFENE